LSQVVELQLRYTIDYGLFHSSNQAHANNGKKKKKKKIQAPLKSSPHLPSTTDSQPRR